MRYLKLFWRSGLWNVSLLSEYPKSLFFIYINIMCWQRSTSLRMTSAFSRSEKALVIRKELYLWNNSSFLQELNSLRGKNAFRQLPSLSQNAIWRIPSAMSDTLLICSWWINVSTYITLHAVPYKLSQHNHPFTRDGSRTYVRSYIQRTCSLQEHLFQVIAPS